MFFIEVSSFCCIIIYYKYYSTRPRCKVKNYILNITNSYYFFIFSLKKTDLSSFLTLSDTCYNPIWVCKLELA